ncbi:MAG: helix-turn-helix domain-containing protein [Gammaproteobacteria bacterium]|uniref:Helix-turn-helix transcriptional regulator n=1 Tax=Candidatus Kutchimonas denitrificans TaxID=3056748 RepID=A0AAE4ZCI4_9BACT|nr:helix-turn-helix transcriptional regulator [Candidatus Kutchimonas denitrificans]NIV53589.1 helix-turn-helix domain-containing protein [Gammaproteobacteria bacterium]
MAQTQFGTWLERMMEEKGVSVEELARAAGIDPKTVQNIISGNIKRPPDDRLEGFAEALGVSLETVKRQLPKSLR